ncbi:hypothetical protein ACTNBM_08565 [Lachnospiraceae bacterium HCP1S3_C3]
MNDFPTNVKEKLNSIISDMADHHWLFSKHPGHDFMRQNLGKLSFYDTMRMIIGMGKGNTNDEIKEIQKLLLQQSRGAEIARQILGLMAVH